MSENLFGKDPYLGEATARVTALTPEGGVVLDRTLFYPAGGGQPGDSGWLEWPGGSMAVTSAEKGEGDDIVLLAAQAAVLPAIGSQVLMRLDWQRRQRHMRLHTALHLLSVVIPLPVSRRRPSLIKRRMACRSAGLRTQCMRRKNTLSSANTLRSSRSNSWRTSSKIGPIRSR